MVRSLPRRRLWVAGGGDRPSGATEEQVSHTHVVAECGYEAACSPRYTRVDSPRSNAALNSRLKFPHGLGTEHINGMAHTISSLNS